MRQCSGDFILKKMIADRQTPAFRHVIAFINEIKSILKLNPAKTGDNWKQHYADDKYRCLVMEWPSSLEINARANPPPKDCASTSPIRLISHSILMMRPFYKPLYSSHNNGIRKMETPPCFPIYRPERMRNMIIFKQEAAQKKKWTESHPDKPTY